MQVEGNKYFTHSWTLGNNAAGDALVASQFADKTVQISGTFNGAQTSIEGSMDAASWFVMSDSNGDPAQFTAVGDGGTMRLLSENPKYIRPINDANGDGNTAVDIIIGGSALT